MVMNLSTWRDLAVVILAFEAFLAGLVPLVMLFLLIRVLRSSRSKLLSGFSQLSEYVGLVERKTKAITRGFVTPLITLQVLAAGARGFASGLSRVLGRS